jgi:hypothetical protein
MNVFPLYVLFGKMIMGEKEKESENLLKAFAVLSYSLMTLTFGVCSAV